MAGWSAGAVVAPGLIRRAEPRTTHGLRPGWRRPLEARG
jgi:hypothetical protein